MNLKFPELKAILYWKPKEFRNPMVLGKTISSDLV